MAIIAKTQINMTTPNLIPKMSSSAIKCNQNREMTDRPLSEKEKNVKTVTKALHWHANEMG